MSTIRVVVADDHDLLREGLVALLDAAPDVVVVGSAADGAEAMRVIDAERPDVALLDVRMPGPSGIDVIRMLTAGADRRVRCVVLTSYDDEGTLFAALTAGACGFVLKDDPPDAILTAVRAASSGDALLSPRVTRRVVERALGRATAARPWMAGLTRREVEVLELVVDGRSNDQIATMLHVEVTTVKSHVRGMLAKIGGRNRIDLIIAYHAGAPSRP